MSKEQNDGGVATLDSLAKSVKSLEELVEKAGQPQFDGQRTRATRDTFSYFMGDDAPDLQGINYNLDNPSFQKSWAKKQMPKGYQGANNRDAGFESFGHFLKSGLVDKGHDRSEWQTRQKSIYKGVEGMSIGAASDGGYLVAPEHTDEILARTYSNDIYSRCDNYSVATNSMKFQRDAGTSRRRGRRHGGLQAFWVGEGQSIPASHPRLKSFQLDCKKLAVIVFLTNELANDAVALSQFVNRTVGEEMNFMVGDSIFNGNGVNQPIGVLNAPNRIEIAADVGQAAATITESNIDRMWERRCVSGSGSYEWYHNQDCCAALDGLAQDVGTGGQVLYRPGGNISTAPFQSLKGARRNETEFSQTLGQAGDLSLIDLSQYITIANGGLTQASSIHVEFLSDQTALRFIMRLDGQPWEDVPVEPNNGTNLQSATISLEQRV